MGPNDKLLYCFDGDRVFIEPATTSTEALYGVFRSDRKAPTKHQIAESRKAYYADKQSK